MPTRRQSQDEIRQHLAEQLDWQFAERNDQAVAQALYAGQAVADVHTLDEAGLLDGFFAFLKESDVKVVWQSYQIEVIQRIFIPTLFFVLLYGTRLLFGIESSTALPAHLFGNVAAICTVCHLLHDAMAHARTRAHRRILRQHQAGQRKLALTWRLL